MAATRTGFARLAVAALVAAAAPAASACSITSTDQAFADEVARMPYVFVARVVDFREVPPAGDDRHGRNEIAWDLVEALKGEPPPSGVLAEWNPALHRADEPPGPSCGPFVATRSRVGQDVLVIASDSRGAGAPWTPSPHSRALHLRPDDGSDEFVRKTRHLIRKEPATP